MLKKLKKIQIPIIVLFLFFVFCFLFLGFVLADDDDDNQEWCAADEANCDANNLVCTSVYGFDWTPNGYPGTAGNPSCCGDDSDESFDCIVVDNFLLRCYI